jgi:RNA polymerase sigma-70 factor (ECF subfamily)
VEPPPPHAVPVADSAPARDATAARPIDLEAAFARLAPVAHGIALARLGPSEADDVVQDVFLSLHTHRSTIRVAEALPGWVRTATERACVDRLRRRGRVSPGPLEGDVEAREGATPEEGLARRILATIQRLPEAYREPLVWRLVEGLSGPQIAERTGMTPGSVRVNLCRGMALLRPLLEADGLP